MLKRVAEAHRIFMSYYSNTLRRLSLFAVVLGINLWIYATEYPLRIQTEDIIYEAKSEGKSFEIVGLTALGKTKSQLTIEGSFIVDGKKIFVSSEGIKSENVTEIVFKNNSPRILDPYHNTPKLANVTYAGPAQDYYSEDGVIYRRISDTYELVIFPPSKMVYDFIIPEGVNRVTLTGNRYVNTIHFPSTVSSISMTADTFPELGEIIVSEENKNYLVIDGSLYAGNKTSKLTFIHFPIQYSDTFIANVRTTKLNYLPNVKTIVIDSPNVALANQCNLGNKVESLIFTKPTNKDYGLWSSGKIDYDFNLSYRSFLYGENLKHVVLPENVGFSPSKFAKIDLIKSETRCSGTKSWSINTYKVSYPKELRYVKGGWLEGGTYNVWADPTIGIRTTTYAGAFKDENIFERDETTTIQKGEVIYPSETEFHLAKPFDYNSSTVTTEPTDFNSLDMRLYYDNILYNLTNVSAGAHGIKVDWKAVKNNELSTFNSLQSLDIYFGDDSTGLVSSHLGNLFDSKNSYMPVVTQYNEDGSTSTLRRPTNLQHIGLYGNIDYIPYGYFSNFISLESVVLPESIYSIGDKAFYGCSKLNELRVYSSYPPVVYDNTFKGVRTGMVHLLVPTESVELYRSDDSWKTFFIEPVTGDHLTINKSILEAGEVFYEFSGKFGSTAQLRVTINPGYFFVGWFDQRLNFLGNTSVLNLTIDEPTVINALFLPEESAGCVTYMWHQNGDLVLSVPADDLASMFRVSCYAGSIQGIPLREEIFNSPNSQNRSRYSGNNENYSITLCGLSGDRDYNIVIEVLDEKMNTIKAYSKKVKSRQSGILNSYADYADISFIELDGNNLSIESSIPFNSSAYTLDGKRIFEINNQLYFNTSLPNGFVILRINNKIHKLIVK